jgi:hypothetical protein
MGRELKNNPTNPQASALNAFRVQGTDSKLTVVDASIFPNQISAQNKATIGDVEEAVSASVPGFFSSDHSTSLPH